MLGVDSQVCVYKAPGAKLETLEDLHHRYPVLHSEPAKKTISDSREYLEYLLSDDKDWLINRFFSGTKSNVNRYLELERECHDKGYISYDVRLMLEHKTANFLEPKSFYLRPKKLIEIVEQRWDWSLIGFVNYLKTIITLPDGAPPQLKTQQVE